MLAEQLALPKRPLSLEGGAGLRTVEGAGLGRGVLQVHFDAAVAVALKSAERRTAMTYWLYKDTQGHWRWNLTTPNNKKIADSGESFKNKKDCEDAIALVKSSKDALMRER